MERTAFSDQRTAFEELRAESLSADRQAESLKRRFIGKGRRNIFVRYLIVKCSFRQTLNTQHINTQFSSNIQWSSFSIFNYHPNERVSADDESHKL
jgi:hypothetical protein